jgi:hypothetical protein
VVNLPIKIKIQPTKVGNPIDWELLEAVFSMRSVPRLYNISLIRGATRVETGSNTSTVTLRVVEGDKKEASNLRQ